MTGQHEAAERRVSGLDDPALVPIEGACAVLGVSRSSFDRLRAEPGFPPPFRIGRLLRFNTRALCAWLASRAQAPAV